MPKNELLKKQREARNWTQKRLAELVEVSEKTVRSWERGERGISLPSRERLVEVFGLSAEELGFSSGEESGGESREETVQTVVFEKSSLDFSREVRVYGFEGALADVRRRLLKRVTLLVEGILQRSLYRETLIILGLQEQPDAVDNPWRFVLQESELPFRELPGGTSTLRLKYLHGQEPAPCTSI